MTLRRANSLTLEMRWCRSHIRNAQEKVRGLFWAFYRDSLPTAVVVVQYADRVVELL
jgi:hypothetical protein